MVYAKRKDGRKFDELRKMDAKVGVLTRADGSAMFKMGDSVAIAAVFGPRELHPRFLQDPERGVLRCTYDMLSFSVNERKRPGPNRRSVEISMVTAGALMPSLDLKNYENTVIDIFIMILQANAGTRCAGINAAALALADAGLNMKDMVSAVSVGKVGDKVVIDLDKDEEDFEEGATDIPVAMMPRNGEVTLLQLDGDIKKEELNKALEYAKKACLEVNKIQTKALKDKYR